MTHSQTLMPGPTIFRRGRSPKERVVEVQRKTLNLGLRSPKKKGASDTSSDDENENTGGTKEDAQSRSAKSKSKKPKKKGADDTSSDDENEITKSKKKPKQRSSTGRKHITPKNQMLQAGKVPMNVAKEQMRKTVILKTQGQKKHRLQLRRKTRKKINECQIKTLVNLRKAISPTTQKNHPPKTNHV